jgi:hypothetical protein
MKAPAILFLIGVLALGAPAQSSYRVGAGTKFFIDGTSTLHDWTAEVQQVEGELTLGKEFSQKKLPPPGSPIPQARIRCSVKSIVSGKGSVMDDRIYAAFDEPQHPHILFDLQEGKVLSITDEAKGIFRVSAAGMLSMAGQSRSIRLELEGRRMAPGIYSFSGRHSLRMTEFGMKPPTAMFGQIETGDEVTIRFTLTASQ